MRVQQVCAKNQSFPELLQQFHNHQNMMRVEAERFNHSHVISRIPLLEHYLEGRASWLFDVKAPFKLDMVGERFNGSPSICFNDFPLLVFQINVANGHVVDHWNHKAVLVSGVEFVNGPDGNIPSTVRLYIAEDEFEEVRGGDIYLNLSQGSFKAIDAGINRELCAPPVTRGNQSSHRLEPRMIESTVKIMDGIPKSKSQLIDERSLRLCKVAFNEFAASVRIHMARDHQTFFQAVDSRFNVRNVMVGPCDLVTGSFVNHISENHAP
jgi:hypothetical protein